MFMICPVFLSCLLDECPLALSMRFYYCVSIAHAGFMSFECAFNVVEDEEEEEQTEVE